MIIRANEVIIVAFERTGDGWQVQVSKQCLLN